MEKRREKKKGVTLKAVERSRRGKKRHIKVDSSLGAETWYLYQFGVFRNKDHDTMGRT